MKELTESHLPTTLMELEKKATLNGAEKGWIVGKNVRKLPKIFFPLKKSWPCVVLGDLC